VTDAPRILMTERIAKQGIDLLRHELPEALIDGRCRLDPVQLQALIGSYSALTIRSETRVTEDVLLAAPCLKVIGRAGSGVDNIDLQAAQRRGVLVVHAPRGNVLAVAEHTMALLLALARHIPAATGSLKARQWEKRRFGGVELSNKVLGILGLGKIGREVARRAQAFSMRVLAFDPNLSAAQAQQAGVTLLGKEDVLRQADFVTLHAALPPGSKGSRSLIGARELELLKPGAYLVNCTRGGLIDEAALLAALNLGRLAGVALDVFSQEPIGGDDVVQHLLAHERVLATPHLGASTGEEQARVALEIARNVVTALRGDTLLDALPPSFPLCRPSSPQHRCEELERRHDDQSNRRRS
jgi:D-3-phosphoglycerate dehydrogenase / 2-oxoglutarate reductase